jgi:glycine oxidase
LKQKKILIVGQGLAGSCAALELISRGIEVLVVSEKNENSASKIAAGLFNPLVLKKLNPGWKAFETLNTAKKFYSHWQNSFSCNFFFNKPLAKVILNKDEKREWEKKIPLLNYFANEEIISNPCPDFWFDYEGYGIVAEAGYLDSGLFLEKTKKYLSDRRLYGEEKFNEHELIPLEDGLVYKETTFDELIFCQGFNSKPNTFFDETFFKAVKGQILTVDIPNYNTDYLISKGMYIVPTNNNFYKIGATYEWDELDNNANEKGKVVLENELKQLLKKEYKIIHQMAAVRPASIDRKPVLGSSIKHKNVHIFNGLGTRGVILAPWLANNLCNNILEGAEIDKDCNISRFRIKKN